MYLMQMDSLEQLMRDKDKEYRKSIEELGTELEKARKLAQERAAWGAAAR